MTLCECVANGGGFVPWDRGGRHGSGGGMSSTTISGTCWMCMQGGLSLDPVRFEIGAASCSWRVKISSDDSHFGCWHVMFASCCVLGAEEFDAYNHTVPMVIRKHSSIVFASVKNIHWSEDQQVNLFATKFRTYVRIKTTLFKTGRI